MTRAFVTAASALAAGIAAHSLLNLRYLRRPSPHPASTARISVLLPMRNEAERAEPCLAALTHLYGDVEILVLDDNSTDNTAEVAAAHVDVIRSTDEPPPGWLGKTYACQRLAERATGDVLVFIDADVVLAPDAAVQAAEWLTDVDAVCPYPRQICRTRWQELVQPLLQWSWLSLLPLRLSERTTLPSLSAGNGQFLAVTRAAYDRVGGHAAVAGEVVEDVQLIRALRRSGAHTAMADGTRLAACTMYQTNADMVTGYTKSLHTAVPPAAMAGLFGMYVVAPAIGFASPSTRLIAVGGYAAATLGRVAIARRTEQPIWSAFAHPVAISALTLTYLRSHRRRARGQLQWRGRPIP